VPRRRGTQLFFSSFIFKSCLEKTAFQNQAAVGCGISRRPEEQRGCEAVHADAQEHALCRSGDCATRVPCVKQRRFGERSAGNRYVELPCLLGGQGPPPDRMGLKSSLRESIKAGTQIIGCQLVPVQVFVEKGSGIVAKRLPRIVVIQIEPAKLCQVR
jgi:hypothetical protein